VKRGSWDRVEREHREAVEEFLIRMAGVPESIWRTEPAPGKWSAGQVVEHIALSYEVISSELEGGEPLRLRVPWWLRACLRVFVLPRVLSTGRIPAGGRAARQIRPGVSPAPCSECVTRVSEGARRFHEKILAMRDRARVKHPYFGAIAGRDLLRFMAIHTRHHAAQLPEPGGRLQARATRC
jgi:hypothetical protein